MKDSLVLFVQSEGNITKSINIDLLEVVYLSEPLNHSFAVFSKAFYLSWVGVSLLQGSKHPATVTQYSLILACCSGVGVFTNILYNKSEDTNLEFF